MAGIFLLANHSGLRPFPQPFQAMLSLCSDIDGTTYDEFLTYHKFLNTKERTAMGQGLGLDVADSFWMNMADDIPSKVDAAGHDNYAVMTYFYGSSDTEKNAEAIRTFIRWGWIDSMHTYGDFSRRDDSDQAFSRKLAEQDAAELSSQQLWPTVWINHGNQWNVQNFRDPQNGTDYQQGADPGSPYYHADLTIAGGIHYIWFDHQSAVFGWRTPLYPVTLQDGQKVWGFWRYAGEYDWLGRYQYNWSIYGLDQQLSAANLDKITRNHQIALVAQHLGGSTEQYPFTQPALTALRRLADYQNKGDILVTRTSRALEYARVRDHLEYSERNANGITQINISAIDDPQLGRDEHPSLDSLRGLTFYVKDSGKADIYLAGERLSEQEIVRYAQNGENTVGIKWFAVNAGMPPELP